MEGPKRYLLISKGELTITTPHSENARWREGGFENYLVLSGIRTPDLLFARPAL